ncbi:uncharacterized protein MONBRDRAFT_32986 [Monosiga brevicollis MX1]|uniref:UBA domain-containing protein n=1 Tax=Monosiga brevicollis TaxID=81824 RepID=A9V2W2_MONBE|nr:uncharacterized protein MONBRDRAFT_32986 [Monosiga brevicollis MX1]EDQ87955.1 predicted protein [Monosiga brevicollis MX1]|eukprot:XP_001747031.1 hypothetical protein [Monosiga brevicollis MX1]
MKLVVYNLEAEPVELQVDGQDTCQQLLVRLSKLGLAQDDCQLVPLSAPSRGVIPLDSVAVQHQTLSQAGLQDQDHLSITPSLNWSPKPVPEPKPITSMQMRRFTMSLTATNRGNRTGRTLKAHKPRFGGQELDFHGQLMAVVSTMHSLACQLQQELGVYTPEEDATPEDATDEDATPFDPRSTVNEVWSCVGCYRSHVCMNVEAALVWLLDTEADPSLDRPITPPPKPVVLRSGQRFQPDAAAYQNLMEMGFSHDNVVAALQLTRNNRPQAIHLLLSGADLEAQAEALQNVKAEPDNPIILKILDDPLVLDSLRLPRLREAFEQILQDVQTAPALLNDGLVGSALIRIVKLVQSYEEEEEEEEEIPSAAASTEEPMQVAEADHHQTAGEFTSSPPMREPSRRFLLRSPTGEEPAHFFPSSDEESDDAERFWDSLVDRHAEESSPWQLASPVDEALDTDADEDDQNADHDEGRDVDMS